MSKSNLRLSVPLTRDRVEALAQSIANEGEKRVPPGVRIVVAVTDSDGAWVGVGSNTSLRDIELILRAALHGADRQFTREVEVDGVEAVEAVEPVQVRKGRSRRK